MHPSCTPYRVEKGRAREKYKQKKKIPPPVNKNRRRGESVPVQRAGMATFTISGRRHPPAARRVSSRRWIVPRACLDGLTVAARGVEWFSFHFPGADGGQVLGTRVSGTLLRAAIKQVPGLWVRTIANASWTVLGSTIEEKEGESDGRSAYQGHPLPWWEMYPYSVLLQAP
ncbi:hypothetical protein N7492_002100 [Penicillium capsulatum]|uniref:Uncharacterized protein n=1 Tax=Penicillium capsulatum TaxID=69766 RepID=A0A9W9IKV0_9EURO|nr:hypothetical protein N7492_002100 [Penicillium capsulatum]